MDKSESEKYWAARAKAYEEYWYKHCQGTVEKELVKYYAQALADIQRDIAALYGRFAEDNKLSPADAHKLLTGDEFRNWRMSLEDYLKGIDEGTVLSKELDILAVRSRISRLDKLYAETLKTLDQLGRKTEDAMSDFLVEAYKDRFYHGIYDVAEQTGTMKVDVAVDDDTAKKVTAAPWSGKSYSQRIWKNDQLLGQTLKITILSGIHRGLSVPQMARMVEDKMDAGLSNAKRLVRTEMNYVQNRAALDSIKESGMKYYRFIATLDRRTSSMCRVHDGKVYPIDECRPGENAPPLHPNCRSTIAGSLRAWHSEDGTRAARNEDGKTVHVPKGMTYDTWYVTYVQNLIPTEQSRKFTNQNAKVNWAVVNSAEYRKAFRLIPVDEKVQNVLYQKALDMLKHQDGALYEDFYLVDSETGIVKATSTHADEILGVNYNESVKRAINHGALNLISMHNHPTSIPPSGADLVSAYRYKMGLVICHDGKIYMYSTTKIDFIAREFDLFVDKYRNLGYNVDEAGETALKEFCNNHTIHWRRLN